MNEMRKLMEAVQLNEYLVRRGDRFDGLLSLNVFGDMGMREDSILFYDDPDNGDSPSYEWEKVVKNYRGHAQKLANEIKKYAAKGRTLTSAEAEAAENTWYDGSDAYQSEPEAVEWLPDIYDNQLNTVEEILHGNIEDEHEGDYAPFGEGLEEAYDDEIDGPNPFGTDTEVLAQLVRELQKLERDTSRVYREATQSRRREDFADMVLNELGMTLTEITDLVEKYEDFAQ